MTRDPADLCVCGHASRRHVFGFLTCTGCYGCFWFRLRKRARGWRLARYACGCTGYVDANDELDETTCPQHPDQHGVEAI